MGPFSCAPDFCGWTPHKLTSPLLRATLQVLKPEHAGATALSLQKVSFTRGKRDTLLSLSYLFIDSNKNHPESHWALLNAFRTHTMSKTLCSDVQIEQIKNEKQEINNQMQVPL